MTMHINVYVIKYIRAKIVKVKLEIQKEISEKFILFFAVDRYRSNN
jgi:hypothetical protein